MSDGLASLRARALADAAGCAVGAIYGVFPDLDALILTVNARTLDDIAAALHSAIFLTAGGVHGAAGPEDQLSALALAYLRYAEAHRQRWRALFQHRLPPGHPVPADYAARLHAAFATLDGPLATLRPNLPPGERDLLARSLFSAVHGVVDLGLDEKVAALGPGVLAAQLDLIVRTLAAGLASRP